MIRSKVRERNMAAIINTATVDPSRAVDSDIVIPCPDGLAYLPYQKAGIAFAAAHKDCLNADEAGLGKTIQSIGTINLDPSIRRILVICQGFLKPHWMREFQKWGTEGLIADYVKDGRPCEFYDVTVINYELLKKHRSALRAGEWDILIVDEIQKLKSGKAERTREIFGGVRRGPDKRIIDRISAIPAKRRLFLSGTPNPNGKPKELWPLLQQIDPTGLGSDWYAFAKRYCQLFEIKRFDPAKGKEERVGWKWDGAENLEELQEIMRSRFMVRRLKRDVMKDLPAKRRMILPIEATGKTKKLIQEELAEFEAYAKGRDADQLLLEMPAFGDIAKKMLEIGLALVEPTIEIVEADLEETDKVVVMCYHQEVAKRIAEHFGTAAVLIHGGIDATDRQPLVDRFQQDPTVRALVGTIGAAGTGLTMTAAHIMIFPERSWVPGEVSQAEDRIHRIGQTEQALIKHVVLEGSLSEKQITILLDKQNNSDMILDVERI